MATNNAMAFGIMIGGVICGFNGDVLAAAVMVSGSGIVRVLASIESILQCK